MYSWYIGQWVRKRTDGMIILNSTKAVMKYAPIISTTKLVSSLIKESSDTCLYLRGIDKDSTWANKLNSLVKHSSLILGMPPQGINCLLDITRETFYKLVVLPITKVFSSQIYNVKGKYTLEK